MNDLLTIVFFIALKHPIIGLSISFPSSCIVLSVLSEAAPQLYNGGDIYA